MTTFLAAFGLFVIVLIVIVTLAVAFHQDTSDKYIQLVALKTPGGYTHRSFKTKDAVPTEEEWDEWVMNAGLQSDTEWIVINVSPFKL